MIITQIISLCVRVVVLPRCLFLCVAPSGPSVGVCAQTLQTHPGDLSSRSDASCHHRKWPESLYGFLLQTLEAAGLAEQVGASGAGLLTLLCWWSRCAARQWP